MTLGRDDSLHEPLPFNTLENFVKTDGLPTSSSTIIEKISLLSVQWKLELNFRIVSFNAGGNSSNILTIKSNNTEILHIKVIKYETKLGLMFVYKATSRTTSQSCEITADSVQMNHITVNHVRVFNNRSFELDVRNSYQKQDWIPINMN